MSNIEEAIEELMTEIAPDLIKEIIEEDYKMSDPDIKLYTEECVEEYLRNNLTDCVQQELNDSCNGILIDMVRNIIKDEELVCYVDMKACEVSIRHEIEVRTLKYKMKLMVCEMKKCFCRIFLLRFRNHRNVKMMNFMS